MNIVKTGYSIAATIEPTDTICVKAIKTSANTKQIRPICQFAVSSTPSDVAIPFPPLNLKNTGKVCPITTNSPASCTSNAVSKLFQMFPINFAINIDITPFRISQTKVKAAAF